MIQIILHEDGTYDTREVIEAGIDVYDDGQRAYRVITSRVQEWQMHGKDGRLATPAMLTVDRSSTVDSLGVWRDSCAWPVFADGDDHVARMKTMHHDKRRLAAKAYSSSRDDAIAQASRGTKMSQFALGTLASLTMLAGIVLIFGRFLGWF